MPSQSRPLYGGQALVEGVLIRNADRWAVALRRPDGEIHAYAGDLPTVSGLWTRPFLRGLRGLGVQFRVGMRALVESSTMASAGEIRPLPRLAMASMVATSVVIGLLIFTALPLILTARDASVEPTVAQRLSEGMVKTGLLAVYVIGITRVPSYRRIFSYHGAEHMAVACAEADRPMTIENVASFSPAHPRCGTGFIVILATVDTFVLGVLPRFGEAFDLALRIGFLPITAAIAYELLRWGSRQRGVGFGLNRFGLLSQRLTTAHPDRGQIEVAIAALELCRAPARAGTSGEAVSAAPSEPATQLAQV
ncbi:MAG: DUF1385 domain-containing protein [Candidatus Limnocylindria bacterium]